MKQKSLKIFTATAVAASVIVPVAGVSAASFTDVSPTNSHYDAIQALVERGVINGYENNTYRPNATLTRGQAAKILANALGLDTSSKKQSFTDVPVSLEYIGAINALATAGIFNGYEDGTFKPGAPLTRGQMAKIIVNAFGLQSATAIDLPFTDVSEKNGYRTFIQTLLNYEITQGATATTFAPNEAVKRGQMASFIVRAEKTVTNQTVTLNVQEVKGEKLVTDTGEYDIHESLENILKAENNAALENASVTATVKSGQVTNVQMVLIKASGTADKPVVLDGGAGKLNGSLTVQGDQVLVQNVSIEKDLFLGGDSQTQVTLQKGIVKGGMKIVKVAGKTASLSPVAVDSTSPKYNLVESEVTELSIESDGVEITADATSKVKTAVVNGNVKTVILNGDFESLELKKDGELTLNGAAKIGTLKVTTTGKLTLSPSMKITNLELPAGVDPATIITNYNEIKNNIEKITVGGNTTSIPTPTSTPTMDYSSGNGAVPNVTPSVPSLPDQSGKQDLDAGNDKLNEEKPVLSVTGDEVTGAIVEVTTVDSVTTSSDSAIVSTGDTVKVKLSNGKEYFVASEFDDFFRYNQALKGAKVSFITNHGRIEAITALELIDNGATLLDGGGDVVIYGTIKLSKNIQTLSNITVTENIIIAADMEGEFELRKSKVFGKVETETVTALAKRSMFAGIAPIAAATTRIKITFTDSTVAIIEIKKENVDLYAGGTTEVASVRLFADNTTLNADNVLLPKIVIGQGVSTVVLNATIASVIIESDENIVVSGRGNFDNVVVNTDKNIAVNTTGTIKNMDVKNSKPSVTLGTEVKLQQVTSSLPVTSVISNFEDVKQNIGPINSPGKYFAVDIREVDGKFGTYTLKLYETHGYEVKYKLIDYNSHHETIERNKTKAPADSVTYKEGDEIRISATKKIIIYLVNTENTIVDYEDENRVHNTIRFTTTTAGYKIETTFDVTAGSKVSDTYSSIIKYNLNMPTLHLGKTTIDNLTWSVENGIGFVNAPVKGIFDVPGKEVDNFSYMWLETSRPGSGIVGSIGRIDENTKEINLRLIQDIYSRHKEDPVVDGILLNAINIIFDHSKISKERVAVAKNIDQYSTAVAKATSLENLYDLIVDINKNNK